MTAHPGSNDPANTAVVEQPVEQPVRAHLPGGRAGGMGRYVVLEEIGRGGMGRVLRAYDPKLEREVALKEVLRESLGPRASMRLVAEARAMAKLSAPNVVAVYDVEEPGDDGSRLALVMEYVRGQTLKEWLRQQTRSWREIVGCFRAAGRGLAAAHAAGLLHRDFKPDNVLVGADGAVKVTDFGLAKPHGATTTTGDGSSNSGTRQQGLTREGMVVGTPRYMSPEQHRGEELVAAADQYAFCVALWEALCQDPPFAGHEIVADKTGGAPPWPRADIPRPIAEAVRRGLQVDPGQRWPSMDALLEALAYDPNRRRQRAFLMAGGAGLLLLTGLSVKTYASTAAQRCGGAQLQLRGVWDQARSDQVGQAMLASDVKYAADAWNRTKESLDDYAASWSQQHTDACEATTIRSEQSSHVMDLRMGCLHRAKTALQSVTDVLVKADAEVVRHAHELTASLPPLSRCGDVEALQADVPPPMVEDEATVEQIRAEVARARVQRIAGRYEPALATIDAAAKRLGSTGYRPVEAEVALERGLILERRGEYEAADDDLQRALEIASGERQFDVMRPAARQLMYLVGEGQRDVDEALRYRALAMGLARGDEIATAAALGNYGMVLHRAGREAEAEAEHRKALEIRRRELPPGHIDIATSHNNLALTLQAQGKHAEAETEYRSALEIWQDLLGSHHPDVALARSNLGNVLTAQGHYDQALAEQRVALEVWRESLGPEHPYVAGALNNLAMVLERQGEYEDALQHQRDALALVEASLGANHPKVGGYLLNLAMLLGRLERWAEAEEANRKSLARWTESLGSEHPNVALALVNMGETLLRLGKLEEAEAALREAVAINTKAFAGDHPQVAGAQTSWSKALLETGRTEEALRVAEQAWKHRGQDSALPEERAGTAFVLARCLWATEKPDAQSRARALAQRAADDLKKAGAHHEERALEIRTWLRQRS